MDSGAGCCPSSGQALCTDIDEATLEDNARRLSFVHNLKFEYFDFRERNFHEQVEAAYCIDVIEHIFPSEESGFLKNIAASISPLGSQCLARQTRQLINTLRKILARGT